MRVGVVGCRDFFNYKYLELVLDGFLSRWPIEVVVSGGASGADSLAKRWATKKNIPVIEYLPEWSKYGKKAGPLRNRKIVEDSDVIIAFWDGKSKGTKSTIDIANELGKKVYVWDFKRKESKNVESRDIL